MKTIVLLFTAMLMSLTTVTASEIHIDKKDKHLDNTNRYRYAQPIAFVERGVEFLIFPDGSFDFNTNIEDTFYNDSYYRARNSKRSGVNITYETPHKAVKYSSRYKKRGISVSHDRDGKIRRIGNIYINYDRHGKIKRAGSIYMNYKRGRHATLNQVGGLYVNYNHWGEIVHTRGQVNRHSNSCNICGVVSCDIKHNYRDRHHDDYNNDWYNDDVYNDNYYYYKKNGKVKKSKKRKH